VRGSLHQGKETHISRQGCPTVKPGSFRDAPERCDEPVTKGMKTPSIAVQGCQCNTRMNRGQTRDSVMRVTHCLFLVIPGCGTFTAVTWVQIPSATPGSALSAKAGSHDAVFVSWVPGPSWW
jgi:hypothetical protein